MLFTYHMSVSRDNTEYSEYDNLAFGDITFSIPLRGTCIVLSIDYLYALRSASDMPERVEEGPLTFSLHKWTRDCAGITN